MYPIVGTCYVCGFERHIFDDKCLDCIEKEKSESNTAQCEECEK